MKSLTDSLTLSSVPELRRLRATLKKWRIPILNYWTSRQTNARVEGFNNKAKLVKRRAMPAVVSLFEMTHHET